MENTDTIFIKGYIYSQNELTENGLEYIKETTITLFYKKEDRLYIFEAKPNKKGKYKFLTSLED